MRDEVPDLLVEKLALGELSEGDASAVRERLGEDADERLDAIKRSNAEILEDHPPGEIAAAVRRRIEDRAHVGRSSRGTWWLALPTVAAAAGLLFWVGTRGPEQAALDPENTEIGEGSGQEPEVIVLKGDARLIVQRRRDGEDRQLVDGDTVRAGDLLQLSYHAGERKQGVIVSVDGRGVLTLHHPDGPEGATALASQGAVALPESYELDDAPGFERFFFVTGDSVDVDRVASAVVRLSKREDAATAPLELPADWQQASVLLRKE